MAGKFKVNQMEIGGDKPVLIAGPCVVESKAITFQVAETIHSLSREYNIPVIFKSSYSKANRTSGESYKGPGIDEGLRILEDIKKEFGFPILTDVHLPDEVSKAAEVADILQIPAFLSRQTDLALAVAASGRAVNIKKGQFLAPEDMGNIAGKIEAAGNSRIMLTERGTSFGYHNLVVDFRSFIIMRNLGYPVIYDATHSIQLPAGRGTSSGGNPEYIIPLAKAAMACGIDGLFVETHPQPSQALCDADCQLSLELMKELIESVFLPYSEHK
jgi:2-dehydro-3-deoxyphosphooctonate aldolase (KDO 8-P synthase)